ncbi:MAG: hypothetical protein WD689_05030 [Gaiellaceae bacterium]
MLAGPVAYAGSEPPLALLGALGIGFFGVGTAFRIAEAIPVGLVVVGSQYALFLVLGDGSSDQAAPLVAAALLLAAELGHSALDPPLASASPALRALRAARLIGLAAGAAGVAALVLYAAEADTRSFPAVEALGVLAALAAVGLLALLARRSA